MVETPTRPRIRDPHRRDKIVAAAARLIAVDGYATVSIARIGEEAGIVGSGVYRHFDSKAAVLVAIFDDVIDKMLADATAVIDHTSDPGAALDAIIWDQVSFVVDTRAIAEVYYSEVKNLPEPDRRRLRRKQRRHVETWVDLVGQIRPDLDDASARTLVHAALGVLHSTLNHDPQLPDAELRQVLVAGAGRVLGITPPDDGRDATPTKGTTR